MRTTTLFIVLSLVTASICGFTMHGSGSEAVSIQEPPDGALDASTIASLYAAVPSKGYIYVISPNLTDAKLVIELVRAKSRGVDVRVIAERQKLEQHRERVVLYNLVHYGIPVKIGIRPEPVGPNVSIINDTAVVTVTGERGQQGTAGPTPITDVQRDSIAIQSSKAHFEAMWNDAHSYELL